MGRFLAQRDANVCTVEDAQTKGPTNSVNPQPAQPNPAPRAQILTDISVDDPNFWASLRTRTIGQLNAWVGDFGRKLDEFHTIMSDSEIPSPWGSFASSVLGVFGTPGDVVNAIRETISLVTSGSDKPVSLLEFRKEFERKNDMFSEMAKDLNSDLPFYRMLRKAENHPDSQTKAMRERIRSELDQALSALPTPTMLKQEFVHHWIATSGSRKGIGPVIAYSTRYEIDKANNMVERELRFKNEYDSGPHLLNVPNQKQTLDALKNAYSPSHPLHQLDLQMLVNFNAEFANLPAPTYATAWIYDPARRIWTLSKGEKIDEYSDWKQDVFNEWLSRGRKPTVAELTAYSS